MNYIMLLYEHEMLFLILRHIKFEIILQIYIIFEHMYIALCFYLWVLYLKRIHILKAERHNAGNRFTGNEE